MCRDVGVSGNRGNTLDGAGNYILRETNLEDLFLTMTGRKLQDGQ